MASTRRTGKSTRSVVRCTGCSRGGREWTVPARRRALARLLILVESPDVEARLTERAAKRLSRYGPGAIVMDGRRFRLTFPYSRRRVALVRLIPERQFDSTTKAWTCLCGQSSPPLVGRRGRIVRTDSCRSGQGPAGSEIRSRQSTMNLCQRVSGDQQRRSDAQYEAPHDHSLPHTACGNPPGYGQKSHLAAGEGEPELDSGWGAGVGEDVARVADRDSDGHRPKRPHRRQSDSCDQADSHQRMGCPPMSCRNSESDQRSSQDKACRRQRGCGARAPS